MKSLLYVEMQQDLILKSLGNLILQMDPELTNPKILKFHKFMRYIIYGFPYRKYVEHFLDIIILYLIYQALRFSGCNYVLSYLGMEY